MHKKLFCQLQVGDKFFIPVKGVVGNGSVQFMKINLRLMYDQVYNTYCMESRYYYYIDNDQEVWTDEV